MTTIDLISLIEQRAPTRLVRVATTGGGEYAGLCPWCGGTDRFRVWPEASRPHYWCRGCNAKGDAIQFLRDYCNLSFSDACAELGIEAVNHSYTPPSLDELMRDNQPPGKEWQNTGKLLVERAERYLWHPRSPEGQHVLAYLRGRGLSDETIKAAHFGCIPLGKDGQWWFFEFSDWGLDPETLTEDQRAKGGVRIPDGIVMPWLESERLWKIAIKRPGQPKGKDYGQVLGSGKGLYNVDSIQSDRPAMLVEGEIDCLSITQEAGDLIACVATGSTGGGRYFSTRWIGDLSLASFVLQSFDNDPAGDQGAEYWMGTWESETDTGPVLHRPGALSNCKTRWSTALWKDPNELLCSQPNGICTLREWVEYGIRAAWYQPDLVRQVEGIETMLPPDEKRIDYVDGIRVLSGYSDEAYRSMLLNEVQQATQGVKVKNTLKNYWQ